MNLGNTKATRKRRAKILERLRDGYNINEKGARSALAQELKISKRVMSSDLDALRKAGGPASPIKAMKRGPHKADKTKISRRAHNIKEGAGDYAHEHMQRVRARALSESTAPMPSSEEAIRSAMLNPLLTDGSLDAGAELRIMLAADEGFPAALHHAFLQWGCERLMVMSRPIEHPDTGALEFPHLSPAEQLMAHSRLCQRIETARQLASDEPKLPKLVEVRVVVGGPDTPVKEGRERGGIGPVGDLIKVE
jgi:hypothetical protein